MRATAEPRNSQKNELYGNFFKKNISKSGDFRRKILTARQTSRYAAQDKKVDLSARNRAASELPQPVTVFSACYPMSTLSIVSNDGVKIFPPQPN
jgi:hypothetical protein